MISCNNYHMTKYEFTWLNVFDKYNISNTLYCVIQRTIKHPFSNLSRTVKKAFTPIAVLREGRSCSVTQERPWPNAEVRAKMVAILESWDKTEKEGAGKGQWFLNKTCHMKRSTHDIVCVYHNTSTHTPYSQCTNFLTHSKLCKPPHTCQPTHLFGNIAHILGQNLGGQNDGFKPIPL